MNPEALSELVQLSNRIGRPEVDAAIIGEGNTSTWADEGTFWVKASGSELRTATAAHFVRMSAPRVLAMLEGKGPTDDEVTAWLNACKADPGAALRPSTEALLHAVCLGMPGVKWVVHTHPTAVNGLTCSLELEKLVGIRLFPDQVVVCGRAPLVVPYHDPGVTLARELHGLAQVYIAEHGGPPKEIYLRNHGLIALGRTSREAENITMMAIKSARILQGTMAFGGPVGMSAAEIERIASRTDEHYRQKMFG